MKIVYYTTGITGWGRVIIGISIYNAFVRKNIDCEFSIISNSTVEHLTGGFNHIKIPIEDEKALSEDKYHDTIFYKTLVEIDPDVILFDLNWYSSFYFIGKLKCKKIFLYHQTSERFFSIHTPHVNLAFKPEQFDSIIAIEPFNPPFKAININPIVYRNRDEILPKNEALKRLNLDNTRPACLFSFNRKTGNYEYHLKKYSYLSDIYRIIDTNKYKDGHFPEIDYFNAFDFIVCAGGYNQFWEAVFFDKKTVFEPVPRVFESQERRINECSDFKFDENGADQLAEIIMNM